MLFNMKMTLSLNSMFALRWVWSAVLCLYSLSKWPRAPRPHRLYTCPEPMVPEGTSVQVRDIVSDACRFGNVIYKETGCGFAKFNSLRWEMNLTRRICKGGGCVVQWAKSTSRVIAGGGGIHSAPRLDFHGSCWSWTEWEFAVCVPYPNPGGLQKLMSHSISSYGSCFW